MRWIWPLLLIAATAWMASYNATHADRQLLVPFVDVLFPETAGDPKAMGQRSLIVMAVASAGFTLLTAFEQVRAWQRARDREG